MAENEVTILGAGWAGLLSGLKMQNGNKKVTFVEKDKTLGGLLKSETINGFTFDTGGPHLLFSRNAKILAEITSLLGANVTKMERNNYIYFNNNFIQYPFENGIYALEPNDRVKIIEGIIGKLIEHSHNNNWEPQNFKEWATGIFGDEMATRYLIPYNEKIWKRPLDKMAADWTFTPGRLPYPELESLLEAAAGIKNIGYREQAFFYYPHEGGIKSLYDSLYHKLIKGGSDFVLKTKIESITRTSQGKYLINDKFWSSSVLNTIPLPEAIMAVDQSPSTKKLADKFDWNSVAVVGVALSDPTPEQTAIYVPDNKIVFHRYTWMSSLAKPVKSDTSNLIAEVTIPKDQPFDGVELTNRVVHDLANIGVLKDENKVLFSKFWFHKYGYPIYTLDHNEVRTQAMRILDSNDIRSVGRWGSWHYWNTDMVYGAVDKLEIT